MAGTLIVDTALELCVVFSVVRAVSVLILGCIVLLYCHCIGIVFCYVPTDWNFVVNCVVTWVLCYVIVYLFCIVASLLFREYCCHWLTSHTNPILQTGCSALHLRKQQNGEKKNWILECCNSGSAAVYDSTWRKRWSRFCVKLPHYTAKSRVEAYSVHQWHSW